MKTTILIIAAVLGLQINFLFAGNKEFKRISYSEFAISAMINLAPATPALADFSDVVPEPKPAISTLTPVTPSEADFNEVTPELKANTINLTPETPSFADFDENNDNQQTTMNLNPVTPVEADFE
jgi:hypothetical protein